jgi:hypothetical protein
MNDIKCFTIRMALLLSIVTISGCKENSTNPQPSKTETDYGTYNISSYIPLSVNNRWIYNYQTTVEFAILDRRIKDSLRVSNQLLMFSYGEDVLVSPPSTNLTLAGYYGHRGGTIYLTDTRGPYVCPLFPLLASPIVVNNTWWTDAWGVRDTFRIISVNSGSFNSQNIDTIVAVRRWHNGWVDTTWFGRTVGVLKEVSHLYSTDTVSTIRQLNTFTPTP